MESNYINLNSGPLWLPPSVGVAAVLALSLVGGAVSPSCVFMRL